MNRSSLGGDSGLLLQHPPRALPGDGATSSLNRAGAGSVGAAGLDLVDERFDGGELLGQVAQVTFEGVELFVEVVQSLGQRLDPKQREIED